MDLNVGINRALNKGIPLIKGDIAVILDADDMLSPDYITRTRRVLLEGENNGVGFVYSDSVLINANGEVIGRGISHEFDVELLMSKSYIPGCATTLTKALEAALPLDENIRVNTKVFRWREIVRQGFKGIYIPEQLFNYRMHRDNISGIGPRVIHAVSNGETHHLLEGYWGTARK